jgi:hypothetical protein
VQVVVSKEPIPALPVITDGDGGWCLTATGGDRAGANLVLPRGNSVVAESWSGQSGTGRASVTRALQAAGALQVRKAVMTTSATSLG